ncbi:MAG: ATP-binding protein [Syntrophobacteraceae bacterium]|jgi:SpoVK/Ycf46/Vps4 family AAA+-type ATPase
MGMRYLLEILKIVEGGLQCDRVKVAAYVEQIVEKLQAEGDEKTASRLKRAIAGAQPSDLSLTRFNPNGRVPVDPESRLGLADEEIVALEDAEVFLDSDVLEAVEEFVRYIQSADRLLAEGIGIAPSLLAFGPPGCGKTELARYISALLKLPLLTARTESLISSYLGNTAKNLRILFEHAMNRPCVLFLDEFDAVAKLRDDRHELGELKRVVVSLLQNIDALDNKTVLIAATNHEHLLDEAIWRRFNYRIHMNLPGQEVRDKLFWKFLGRFALAKDIRLFSKATEGLSGSDIRQICENAVRSAILQNTDQVSDIEVLKRILKFRLPQDLAPGASLKDKLHKVRELDPKVFTYRRLAEIFGASLGTVSQHLQDKE